MLLFTQLFIHSIHLCPQQVRGEHRYSVNSHLADDKIATMIDLILGKQTGRWVRCQLARIFLNLSSLQCCLAKWPPWGLQSSLWPRRRRKLIKLREPHLVWSVGFPFLYFNGPGSPGIQSLSFSLLHDWAIEGRRLTRIEAFWDVCWWSRFAFACPG